MLAARHGARRANGIGASSKAWGAKPSSHLLGVFQGLESLVEPIGAHEGDTVVHGRECVGPHVHGDLKVAERLRLVPGLGRLEGEPRRLLPPLRRVLSLLRLPREGPVVVPVPTKRPGWLRARGRRRVSIGKTLYRSQTRAARRLSPLHTL